MNSAHAFLADFVAALATWLGLLAALAVAGWLVYGKGRRDERRAQAAARGESAETVWLPGREVGR